MPNLRKSSVFLRRKSRSNSLFVCFSIQKDEEEARRIKLQLEEIQSANDNLKDAISKINSEYSSKIEAQKKDSEAQVLYLVQQLRVAEAKLRSESAGVWNNGDRIGEGSHGSSLKSAVNTKDSRPRTAGAALGGTTDRSNVDLIEKKKTGEISINPGGEVENNLDEVNIIMKKWHAEKQRREQLEKRNVELTRELRSLKTPSNHGTHQGQTLSK
jgi:hypothetical protein